MLETMIKTWLKIVFKVSRSKTRYWRRVWGGSWPHIYRLRYATLVELMFRCWWFSHNGSGFRNDWHLMLYPSSPSTDDTQQETLWAPEVVCSVGIMRLSVLECLLWVWTWCATCTIASMKRSYCVGTDVKDLAQHLRVWFYDLGFMIPLVRFSVQVLWFERWVGFWVYDWGSKLWQGSGNV